MKISCIAVMLLCAISMPVWAQTTSVSGEVTDSTGAVVVGTVAKLMDTIRLG
jgi:hypothetical protein